jgi:hypothetical protein
MKLLALALLAACNAPAPHAKVPGASLAPKVTRTEPRMCGVDIDWGADGSIDLRYRFTLDDFGRLAHGTGVYTVPHADDVIDYEWDNLDHLVHYTETGGYDTTVLYNSLGDLLDYKTNGEHYTYTDFTELGVPAHEIIAQGSASTTLSLEYDAWNRILRAAPPSGPPTIYSYDDDARTTIVDTDNGRYHGVVVYDADNHELSETWTDNGAVTDDHYTYDGDRLLSLVHREPAGVSAETYRYDCH